MAATAESVTGRTIRVYCVTHKVGFDAQSHRVVLCASGNHALANAFPDDSFWEYCCDCQHCWLIDTAKNEAASDECPACEREIVRRYVCSACNVISIESNEPGRRKLFSLSNGIPSPTCPGCLEKPSSAALEHECKDFGASFLTNFSTCPFCDEVLEAPPDFPCKVSEYLSNLKTPPTVLRFDSQANTLKAFPTGDYVLVPRVPGINVPVVIPNAKRFESKRDYYDTYYELFNCDNPSAGEVIVLRPATVEKLDSGWQIKETGVIEIKADIKQSSAVSASNMVACGNCGTVGNTSQEFCGRCGVALSTFFSSRGQDENSGQPVLTIHQASISYPGSFVPTQEVAADFGPVVTNPTLDNLSTTYAAATSPATTATRTSIAPKIVVGVIAGVLLLVVVIAISLSVGGNTVEKQLDEAIVKGNLFPPPTQNARDLYTQLKNAGANEDTLRRYRERLVPLLTSQATHLIQNLMQPGYDEAAVSDWQSAAKSILWATEFNPADNALAAKSSYCQGRVAYLAKQGQDAIQHWTQAAKLDQSWALPLNSAGLVYASEKNYSAARSLYFEAIRRNSNWANPYNNLGTSYYMEKNYSEAKVYYQKAVQIAPDWARPHAWLGDIAMNEKDFATAVSEYQAVLGPKAIGIGNMNLEKIREKFEQAQRLANSGEKE